MSVTAWGDAQTRFFFDLTPERVLEAVESTGLRCTGRCSALNSFENRVYEVELDIETDTVFERKRVVKFYRPGRWSREQILEEHEFLLDLQQAEIPVVAPISLRDGSTLRVTREGDIAYALFPKVGGRAPDELSDEQLRWIGRLLARVHGVGQSKPAPHRIEISCATYGLRNLEWLLGESKIPLEFAQRYEAAARAIFDRTEKLWREILPAIHRVHGDCHLGNLLWHQGPFFLDFDDMVRGPAVQDIWLLVPGRDEDSLRQREVFLEGYEEIQAFDRAQLRLIEPLRALRFIHYTAWIARRWDDPAFPLAFPQFNTHRYWQDETQDLESQLSLIT